MLGVNGLAESVSEMGYLVEEGRTLSYHSLATIKRIVSQQDETPLVGKIEHILNSNVRNFRDKLPPHSIINPMEEVRIIERSKERYTPNQRILVYLRASVRSMFLITAEKLWRKFWKDKEYNYERHLRDLASAHNKLYSLL